MAVQIKRATKLLLVAIASAPSIAWGQTAPAPSAQALAERFGARLGIEASSLSPDGDRLALIVPHGDGQEIQVADFVAGGPPKTILTINRPLEQFTSCQWATDKRLFCQIRFQQMDTGIEVAYYRMVAMDANGGNLAVVTPHGSYRDTAVAYNGGGVIDWNGTTPGQVLMTRQFIPENTMNTRLAQTKEGLGVESVNVTTLARSLVETPRDNASDYITDGLGHVRLMESERQSATGYSSGVADYLYRKANDRAWHALGAVDAGNGSRFKGFLPVAVDAKLDAAVGFDTKPDGRLGVFSIRLDGSGTRTLLLGRDDVDVDHVIMLGRQRRVVGASYATERREVEFFDPELKALRAALSRALPNAPSVGFIGASADEKRLLLVASSDTDPGMVYRYDKTTHSLEKVLPLRPELAGMTLATMTPVSFPARDGTMIPGYLTLPPTGPRTGLPAIVMPHGGPSARDEWGFDWLVQYFAARGYAVLQPNYRGSSGYGTGWSQINAFKSWPTAIGDIDDAGRWLLAKEIAAPGHLAIVGWSYGGYAALQSGVTDPGLFKAIVAVAPVTDLARLRQDTLKYTSGGLVDNQIGHGDYVTSGSPALNAGRITVPVLMFHGDHDLNVDIGHSREMADKLRGAGKSVDLVEFKNLDHQLDSAAARSTLLSRSDTFLRKAMGL